jgi:hypothetical protein
LLGTKESINVDANSFEPNQSLSEHELREKFEITKRVEVGLMTDIFLGRWGKFFFYIVIIISFAHFSSSLSSSSFFCPLLVSSLSFWRFIDLCSDSSILTSISNRRMESWCVLSLKFHSY